MAEQLPDDIRAVRYTIVGLFSVAALISLAINLAAVAIVIGIYSVLSGQFEIILTSVLILIYAKIDAYAHDSTEHLSQIKKLVGALSGTTKTEEDPTASAASLGAQAITALMRLIAFSVIQLIAIWNLVKAIGWI